MCTPLYGSCFGIQSVVAHNTPLFVTLLGRCVTFRLWKPPDRRQATITPDEQLRIAMEALTEFIERKVEAKDS